MTEEIRSVIAWVGLQFLSVELCAHFQLTRWQAAPVLLASTLLVIALWPVYTFSGTNWHAIAWWSFIGFMVAAFFAVLLGHFEWHWSARWLLTFGAAAAFVIAAHAIEKALR